MSEFQCACGCSFPALVDDCSGELLWKEEIEKWRAVVSRKLAKYAEAYKAGLRDEWLRENVEYGWKLASRSNEIAIESILEDSLMTDKPNTVYRCSHCDRMYIEIEPRVFREYIPGVEVEI